MASEVPLVVVEGGRSDVPIAPCRRHRLYARWPSRLPSPHSTQIARRVSRFQNQCFKISGPSHQGTSSNFTPLDWIDSTFPLNGRSFDFAQSLGLCDFEVHKKSLSIIRSTLVRSRSVPQQNGRRSLELLLAGREERHRHGEGVLRFPCTQLGPCTST